MKELNKKLLENEQKLSDFFTAKEVVGRKRHADEDLNEAHDEKSNGEPAAKKMKTWKKNRSRNKPLSDFTNFSPHKICLQYGNIDFVKSINWN